MGCSAGAHLQRRQTLRGSPFSQVSHRSSSLGCGADGQPEGERQRRSDGRDLTPRELSVIDLLREGKPNKLIAARLEMQESTVKVHVRSILKKLNATNRTHAAFVANRLLGQDAEPVALPNSLRLGGEGARAKATHP
jgi:DNA-binding NarL/FixJ family response regulator